MNDFQRCSQCGSLTYWSKGDVLILVNKWLMMLQPVPRLLKLNFLFRLQKCFTLPCRFHPRKLKTKLETQISFPGDYLVSTMDQLIENKENIEHSANTCEKQYLNAIEHIINHGSRRSNRTGIDTLSVFGMQMRYNIREAFPLFTTKRVFWRGILEEMLWFIRGCTNSNKLKDKNVHIWDANGSRNFLDNLGFTEREEGDLGPVYGFQWRHFGAEYADFNTDYTNKGVDQLRNVIDLIKKNPDDRRIIMSAWNPVDLPKMALPPCHVMCQFYVNNGELSCQMYQRSGDMGLGVPFNVASYSLLVYMIAHITGLKPGDFIHTLGDAHVYVNHVKPLKIQLQRALRPLPTLKIKRQVTDIDDFKVDDFEILNYKPHNKIQMDMAV